MAGDAAHSMPTLTGKRETLTARAERIIGRSLHTQPLANATTRGKHNPQIPSEYASLLQPAYWT